MKPVLWAIEMSALRALIREHRHLAMVLLVTAFFIKAIVPAGFMVSQANDTVLAISICSDANSQLASMQMVIPAKETGSGHPGSADPADHCAYSGLSHAALGGTDAILLAIAFAFILVLGLAPSPRLPFGQVTHLRPPLRGPPAAA